MMDRRAILGAATAGLGLALAGASRADVTIDLAGLKSLTTEIKPIGPVEYARRLEALRRVMKTAGIKALIVESGSSLTYFTGVQWWRSERVTAAMIPVVGEPIIVTPFFETPSVRETLSVPAEIRPWNEDENPEAILIGALKDRGAASGKVAIESTTRLFILEGLKALCTAHDFVSGAAVVAACRQIKSDAELALMQLANTITLKALKFAYDHAKTGMGVAEINGMIGAVTRALGGQGGEGLVLINEASAYPHGSHQKQVIRDGSTVLMDCGCTVGGYTSDISRTFVFGTPSAKQRKVWVTVKRGQEIALETAKIGLPVGKIDDAVRAFYEREGWGPGYHLPGLSHRTGHGIGMDGHESPYLVHGDATPLQAGMCFSDEPGLYLPGEFGIRLEDCWVMTEAGPKLFTPLAASLDAPI